MTVTIAETTIQVTIDGVTQTVTVASGATSFVGLNDVPHSYVGQTGKTLLVNALETGLEFGTVSGGSGAVDSVNGHTGVVVLNYSDVGAVPTARTLTINGTAFDLSTNRAWVVGDAIKASSNVFSAHNAMGNNAAVDDGSLFYPTSSFSNIFGIQETFTVDDTLDFVEGQLFYLKITPTATINNTAIYGIDFEIETANNAFNINTSITGMYAAVGHKGSGTVALLEAAAYDVSAHNGTVTDLVALDLAAHTDVGAHTVNGYGVRFNSGSAGTVDTAYAMWLDHYVATISYGIWSEGGENRLKTGGATIVGLAIQRAGAQSAHLINTLDSDGTTVLSYMNSAGVWHTSALGTGTADNTVFLRGDGTWATASATLDADLTAIAALTGTGVLQRTGVNTWAVAALVAADIPNLAESKITNLVSDLAAKQSLDATLTSLAAFNTNGLLTQTATDTFTGRTLTGTSNRLSVTNGDGVAGNPTLDISSSYVGQATITTLGTISAGVWNGTLVGATYGGTGINNGSNTLTLGGVTSITGGGTIALGGFTATIPATLTVAGLAIGNVFSVAQVAKVTDTGTNAAITVLTITHNSSGSIAANFGTRLLYQGQSTTTADLDMASVDAAWSTATHASRTANVVINAVNNAGALAEIARFTPNGMTIMNNQSAFFAQGQLAIISNGGAAQIGNQSATAGSSTRINGGTGTGATNFVSFFLAGVEQARFISAASAASSAAVVDNLILRRNPVSGTPAAGTGHQIHFVGKSDTTADKDQFTLSAEWIVETNASYTTRVKMNVYDASGAREAMRMDSDGSVARLGWFGATAVVKQTSGANLTNNVTSGGTTDQIDNFTDLTIYANDAAAIRNNIYQLSRKLKQINDGLRSYGLFT